MRQVGVRQHRMLLVKLMRRFQLRTKLWFQTTGLHQLAVRVMVWNMELESLLMEQVLDMKYQISYCRHNIVDFLRQIIKRLPHRNGLMFILMVAIYTSMPQFKLQQVFI